MANKKCPKCGSERLQLSNVRSNHGLIKFIFFGWFYLLVIGFKWMVGLALLVLLDSWASVLARKNNKGYVWQSKKWFSTTKKTYYCHDCYSNFNA